MQITIVYLLFQKYEVQKIENKVYNIYNDNIIKLSGK